MNDWMNPALAGAAYLDALLLALLLIAWATRRKCPYCGGKSFAPGNRAGLLRCGGCGAAHDERTGRWAKKKEWL